MVGGDTHPPPSFRLSVFRQYLLESSSMKSNKTSKTTDINDPALGFQRLKGFYILDYDCVLTRHQVVDVLGQYLLVDFEDDGLIKYRTVSFWHASLKDEYLKIVVYDISNKVIISRLHNISDTDAHCNWVLMDTDILESENKNDDLLEFDFS